LIHNRLFACTELESIAGRKIENHSQLRNGAKDTVSKLALSIIRASFQPFMTQTQQLENQPGYCSNGDYFEVTTGGTGSVAWP
jgi:hypothetical protein